MKNFRIFVTGPSGSGKTFCANILSDIMDISSYTLDEILYPRQTPFNPKTHVARKLPDTEFIEKLDNLLKHTNWIVDGVIRDNMSPVLDLATHIVVMKTPRYVCASRAFHRAISRTIYNYTECNFLHVGWLWPGKNFVARRVWRAYPKHQARIDSFIKETSLPVSYVSYENFYPDIIELLSQYGFSHI